MGELEAANQHPAGHGEGDKIIKIFDPLNRQDYIFTSIKSPCLRWIFRYLWLLPLALVLFSAAANLGAYLMTEDPRLTLELAKYRRNFIDDYRYHDLENGHRIYYYKLDNNIYYYNCKIQTNPDTNERRYIFQDGDIIVRRLESERGCVTPKMLDALLLFSDSINYLAPIMLFLLSAIVLYVLFIKRAPKSFYQLAKSGRMKPGSQPVDEGENQSGETTNGDKNTSPWVIRPRGWETYVIDLESALQSRWRWVCTAGLLPIILFVAYLFTIQRDSPAHIRGGFWPQVISEIVLLYIFPVVLGGLAGFAVWPLFVVGFYIAWLRPTFVLDIQPTHPDGCGGLKRIGDILLQMALIALTPAALLSLWALTGILAASISAVAVMVYVTLALVLLIATITFVGPVLKIHTEMSQIKEELEYEAGARRSAVEGRLRALVAIDADQQPEGQALQKRLELINLLYPTDLNFRTWPFGRSTLAIFLVGQVISILGWLAGAVQAFDIVMKWVGE